MRHSVWVILSLAGMVPVAAGQPAAGPAWKPLPLLETDGARVALLMPAATPPGRPLRLVFYLCPNGNTLEQTLGAARKVGRHWQFDIQQVAAQVACWADRNRRENVALAVGEARGLSWPAWRRSAPLPEQRARKLLQTVMGRFPQRPDRLTLMAHSGGGSFLHACLEAPEPLPAPLDRIAFLDANYSTTEAHGDRLLSWLQAEPTRSLVVLAYDDRNIMLNGKPVIGPEGGTFRATGRLLERLRREVPVREETAGAVRSYEALDGRIAVRVALNPENRILHTTMVGDWNGILFALSWLTPEGGLFSYGPPRSYDAWIAPEPFDLRPEPPAQAPETAPVLPFPPREAQGLGGQALTPRIADLTGAERDRMMAREILAGNVPDRLRTWRPIRLSALCSDGIEHTGRLWVSADYLGAGSNEDWVRAPLRPETASAVASALGAALPTRKIADLVFGQSSHQVPPIPLVDRREHPETFLYHHQRIEARLGVLPPGALVAGIKKDVVVTPRLSERANRLAIYGWHKPGGEPIQPLTLVHVSSYVDYSHGIRLVRRRMEVDGKEADFLQVLRDPVLSVMVSDEGPVTASYPEAELK